MDLETAITHPGQADRDEFLALCMLISENKIDRIERRAPTKKDLANKGKYVIDVGEKYDAEALNFDHHQLPADAEPTCALFLVLSHLGVDRKPALAIWGWLSFTEWIDSKGPFQTAKHLGMTPDTALFECVSPIETTVLRWFQEQATLTATEFYDGSYFPNPLWVLMQKIGDEKLSYLKKVVKRIKELEARTVEFLIEDIFCLESYVPVDDDPQLGLELYCKQREDRDDIAGKIAVTITRDDRIEENPGGACMYRRNDDPRIDLSLIKDEDDVVFAHNNGFVAKIKAGADWEPLLKKSIVREPATSA